MIALVVASIVAAFVTSATTPWAMALAAKYGAIAIPRDRDVHSAPTPRWGGIAIYAGTLTAVALAISIRHVRSEGANGWNLQIMGLLAAGTFIAFIGLLDDLRDLRPLWQIGALLGAGLILYSAGVRIEGVTHPGSVLAALGLTAPGTVTPRTWLPFSPLVSVVVTLGWVGLVTKTVDAIDGLDGLAAGVCAISAATLAILAVISPQSGGPSIAIVAAAIAGACIGFLRYNFHPAKVFMSTVGAQFIGLTLAGLSIMGAFKAAAAVSVLIPFLVLAVPIVDYGVVLVRRFLQGAPLMRADRRHLHHRLLDRGLSQRQAVCVIYAVTLALCAAAVLLFAAGQSPA